MEKFTLRKPNIIDEFDSVLSNHLGKAQHTVTMEQMEIYDFGLDDANVKIPKSNKCNQCVFASSRASDLMRHLKMHSGEKSNATNVSLHLLGQAI